MGNTVIFHVNNYPVILVAAQAFGVALYVNFTMRAGLVHYLPGSVELYNVANPVRVEIQQTEPELRVSRTRDRLLRM
jgi:hypothetical protein